MLKKFAVGFITLPENIAVLVAPNQSLAEPRFLMNR